MGYEDELRLLYAVALNAIALAAAYRFARRRLGGDFVRRLIDAGLIYYLLQYVVIGALGSTGLLSPWSIGPLALMLCALLWVGSGWRRDERNVVPPTEAMRVDRAVVIGCFAFVAAYALSFAYQQRNLPPTADDALTYHLPAAVQWLQTGRIELFPTWFFNPANTYSPLGGSMFMAWLIAPMGNDVLVRYVQVGPLLLLFLVVLEMGRLLGGRTTTAALVAAGCVMTRSFINQVIVPKDDLFLTAFCVAAVMSLARGRADENWSPARAGTAIGLLLAMKYTAMFSLPILLLMVDVPLRDGRWRRFGWIIAALVVLVTAGPWYLRNAMLTGNPLFPIDVRIGGVGLFAGLFSTTRSSTLTTPGGIIETLVGGRGFYGPPTIVGITLLLAWAAAVVLRSRTAIRDPLWRACLFGSMISIALFALAAPYAEVRFVYPAIALLFAVAAGVAGRIPRRGADDAVAGVLLAIVLFTTLRDSDAKQGFAVIAVFVAATISIVLWFTPTRLAKRVWIATGTAAVLVVTGIVYVHYGAYVRNYAEGRAGVWATTHGEMGHAWGFIDRDVPSGASIAYANTHFVYPLQGVRLRNRIVHASVRANLVTMQDLPRSPTPLAGEQIADLFAEQTRRDPDAKAWRANLAASGAEFLVVGKSGPKPPPELALIALDPSPFVLLYDDPAAAVYRIRDVRGLAD